MKYSNLKGDVNKTAYKILTPAEREKKWRSLTLGDDYLFCKIMSDKILCTEMIHRIFPYLNVNSIEDVVPQKSEKLALHIRGVRFDIFTRIAQAIMDFEAQNKKLADIFKRPRAYQTVLTYDELNVNNLKVSGNYKDLKDCYVVFICTFDPFRKGRHIYSFENYCTEDKQIALGDGAHIVYLNTNGKLNDVNPELKRFLDFVDKNKVSEGDSFIEKLDQRIKEAKENTEWRREFMTLLTIEDEKFAEGRAEGRNEGIAVGEQRAQRSIYERLVSSGKLSPQEAADLTGWNAGASYGLCGMN